MITLDSAVNLNKSPISNEMHTRIYEIVLSSAQPGYNSLLKSRLYSDIGKWLEPIQFPAFLLHTQKYGHYRQNMSGNKSFPFKWGILWFKLKVILCVVIIIISFDFYCMLPTRNQRLEMVSGYLTLKTFVKKINKQANVTRLKSFVVCWI